VGGEVAVRVRSEHDRAQEGDPDDLRGAAGYDAARQVPVPRLADDDESLDADDLVDEADDEVDHGVAARDRGRARTGAKARQIHVDPPIAGASFERRSERRHQAVPIEREPVEH
jgi:hypothetical protein